MIERDFDQMERDLLELGRSLSWVSTPDLTVSVSTPVPFHAERRWRRWLVAAALLLVVISGILAASSTVRESVADFLGIDGLRIEVGRPDTTPVPNPIFGTPTSIQDFERWLPFTTMEPSSLGTPDARYLRVLETGQLVGISVWPPSELLPEATEIGTGALLMQFSAPYDAVFLLKTIDQRTATVMETTVNGQPAYWVEGTSSLTVADLRDSETRPSANVLIWQTDDVGYRFESALSMDEAVSIAESLEPIHS